MHTGSSVTFLTECSVSLSPPAQDAKVLLSQAHYPSGQSVQLRTFSSTASHEPAAQIPSYLAQYRWFSPGFVYKHHPVTFIFISCNDAELQDTIVIDLPGKTNAILGQNTATNAVKASFFL